MMVPIVASVLVLAAPAKPAYAQWYRYSAGWLELEDPDAPTPYYEYAQPGSTAKYAPVSPSGAFMEPSAVGSTPDTDVGRGDPEHYTSGSAHATGHFRHIYKWSGTGTPPSLSLAVAGSVHCTAENLSSSADVTAFADHPNGGTMRAYGTGTVINFPNSGTYSIAPSSSGDITIIFEMQAAAHGSASGRNHSYAAHAYVNVSSTVQ